MLGRRGNGRVADAGDDVRAAPTGALDTITGRTLTGWAWDGSEPGERQLVWVRINGTVTLAVRADVYRADLDAAGIGDGAHAFELPIPDTVREIDTVTAWIGDDFVPLAPLPPGRVEPASNRPLPAEWRPGPACALPSFFLLGAAKSGTTSLHGYLDQHPDVCMSRSKEPFFFEAEHELGPRYYLNRYFAHWQGEPIVGEARHRNLFLPHVPALIHAHNPNARLLVILRNPVERLVSHWWHWHRRGEDPLPLGDAVAADLRRIDAGLTLTSPAERSEHARTVGNESRGPFRTYVDSGYYATQLERYVELFGRDRLRVVQFEELAAQPRAVVDDSLRFLGADPAKAPAVDYRPLNRSEPGMRAHLSDELTVRLVEHYRPHNRALEALLGGSLAHWDRPFADVGAAEEPRASA